jgi:hypothetical protein
VNSSDLNLLFATVETALEAERDVFDAEIPNEVLQRLRDVGYVELDGNRLREEAFLEYFRSFELLSAPQ